MPPGHQQVINPPGLVPPELGIKRPAERRMDSLWRRLSPCSEPSSHYPFPGAQQRWPVGHRPAPLGTVGWLPPGRPRPAATVDGLAAHEHRAARQDQYVWFTPSEGRIVAVT